MTEKRMTEKRMTENIITEKTQSLAYLSHKEFHIIMNRPQFKSDLTGQDATDYDDFIDAKIQEYIKAHNDTALTLIKFVVIQ
jgi:hypothetical protein